MKNQKNFKNNLEIYPLEKEKENKKTVWEHYFARKIAFLFLPIFLKLKISANKISFLSIFIGIVAAILIATGDFFMIIMGGILMQIWLVLDKTDGLVARYRKTISRTGKFLEELNGSLMVILFFLSIGFAASRIPGWFPFSISSTIFLFLGLATSLFIAFRHLIFGYFRTIFSEPNENNNLVGSGIMSNLYNFSLKFTGVYSLAQPIFLLAVIFNFLGLYIFVYFVIHALLMILSVIYLIYRANRNDFRE